MRLTVSEAQKGEVYKDTARVHRDYRSGLRSGSLAKISVLKGTSAIVAVRGLDDGNRERILLDLETRRRLGVHVGKSYEFSVSKIWPWQHLLWAWNASDPAARVGTRIAVWSFVIGVVVGFVPTFVQLVASGEGDSPAATSCPAPQEPPPAPSVTPAPSK